MLAAAEAAKLRVRPALLFSGGLLLWSVLPLAMLLVDVHRFGGVLSGSDGWLPGSDQQLYLAWVRDSGEQILISNRYRLGESDAVFIHPMTLISGVLWQLGLGLKLSVLVWKPVAALVLGVGVWAYVRRLLPTGGRLAAAVLAVFFFSPVLPLLVWSGTEPTGLDRLYLQFFSGETMVGLQMWGYLHAAITVGLMALFLLGVERALDPERRAPERSARWYLAWVSVAGLLVGWLHPWQGMTLLAIVGALAVWGRLARRYWALAIPALATAAPMAYEFALSKLDSDWRLDAAQNTGSHAPLWILLVALLPLALPAFAGVRRTVGDDQERMLLLWPLFGLIAYLAATQFPFHALQGISVPLAVLAVRGYRRLPLPAPAGIACVAVLTLPGMAFVADTFRDSRTTGIAPYRLTANENDAIRHLERAPRRGGVLTRHYLGMTMPSLAGQRTWVGQFTWSPDFKERRRRTDDLFAGRLGPVAARRMVAGIRPAYLLADCTTHPDVLRQLAPVLRTTRHFGCVSVSELAPPG